MSWERRRRKLRARAEVNVSERILQKEGTACERLKFPIASHAHAVLDQHDSKLMHTTENYTQNCSTMASRQPALTQKYKSQDVLTAVALISFFI